MTLTGRLFVALQHVLPQRLLSRLVHAATRWRWRPWKTLLIRFLARLYRIDLDEVARRAPDEFIHFNDFFTRELRPGARPLADEADAVVSPADGRVSRAGIVRGEHLLQAKGRDYTLTCLLGGRAELAERFVDGSYATIYLAPRDYHRVHMPLTATLTGTVYVPGRLFSVNPTTVGGVEGLFARNERLVCLFRSDDVGELAVVLVGAMLVSSIETVWEPGEMERGRRIVERTFEGASAPTLSRGAELGRFSMGSTVIVLYQRDRVRLENLDPGSAVRMGQRIGELRAAAQPGSPAREATGRSGVRPLP